MKNIKYLELSYYIPIVSLIFYFAYKYQYSFNYQIRFNESYFLAFISSIIYCFYLAYNLFKERVSWFNAIFFILLTVLQVNSYLCPNIEQLTVLFSVLLCLTLFLEMKLSSLKYMLLVFFLLLFLNLIKSTYLLFGGGEIGGIINNKGVVGIYSAINLPVLFYFISIKIDKLNSDTVISKRSGLLLFLLLLILALSLLVIFESRSRTALWTTFLLLLWWIKRLISSRSVKHKISKIFKILVITICSIILGYILINLIFLAEIKQSSLSGRLLMLKISLIHIFDNFWFGVGFGKFSYNFPQWQQEFLKIYRIGKEMPLLFNAGETYIIFNEYLQLFISIGLFFFLITVGILVFLFRTNSKPYVRLLCYIKCIMAGTLFCSLASYPFHVNLILVLFAWCIAFCIKVNNNKLLVFFRSKTSNFRTIIMLLCFSGCILTCLNWTKVNAVIEWHTVASSTQSSEYKEKVYDDIHQVLYEDGKFLSDYGMSILNNVSKDKKLSLLKAINILENSRAKYFNRGTMESLAYAYWMKEDYQNSICYFEWLDNYQPYLFEPKLALMHLYIKTKENKKAKEIGQLIATMPEKIPSRRIFEIKIEAKQLFRKHNLDCY